MTLTIHPKTYQELLAEVVPQVIETDQEYERLLAVAEELTFNQSKTPGELALFKLVVALIETYETDRYPMPEILPHEILCHLVESSGRSRADLAAMVGISEDEASNLISGESALDRIQAEILAAQFKVSPALFL